MSIDTLLAGDDNKKDSVKTSYQNRLLAMGLVLLVLGLYGIPEIMTSESDLIRKRGTLRSANIYVVPVTDRKGHKSRKSELIFYLNEYEQVYAFGENIGSDYRNEKYNKILRKLQQADSVSVWIKKTELIYREPDVFKIDGDNNLSIVGLEEAKRNKRFFVIICLLFGLICIKIFLWMKFPKRMSELFNLKDKN